MADKRRLELLYSNDWQYNVAFDAQKIVGDIDSLAVVPASVSAPATLALFGLGMAGLRLSKRRSV